MAERAHYTHTRLLAYCSRHAPTGLIPQAWAMKLARAANPRDKRRVLAAMAQANLLRQVEGGYRLLCLVVYRPERPEQPQQLKLALEQPYASTAKPAHALHSGQKAQRKQATRLARAGAMSASKPEKTAPIDLAPTHTEFSEAAFKVAFKEGERSEPGRSAPARVLLPLKRAQANEALLGEAGERGAVADVGDSNGGSEPGGAAVSQPKAASGGNAPYLSLVQGTVDRHQEPPRELHRGRFLPRRVNTQRVTKQQKEVICRKPSSAVQAGELLQENPPMLHPSEASVRAAVARSGLWPRISLRPEDARWIVQQAFTWDEINDALDHFAWRRDNGRSVAKFPSVLRMQLQEQRAKAADQEQAERAKRKGSIHDVAPPPIKGEGLSRGEMAAKIADIVGESRGYICHNKEALEALVNCAADPRLAVALHVEMDREDEHNAWPQVAQAWAAGRRPTDPELLPAPSTADPRKLASVQSVLAKLGIAG